MKIIKTEKPLTAFLFTVTDTGTNFAKLEEEVRAEGGAIEQIADDLVIISLNGTDYTLPLGFVLILGNSNEKIVSKDTFDTTYICIMDDDYPDFDKLIERIEKLEVGFEKLVSKANTNSKPNSKAKNSETSKE